MAASRINSAALSRVTVLELVEERQFSTKGTNSYVYYLISDTDFEEVGPWLESLQIAAEVINPSSGFIFKVIGRKSYRGQSWEDFAEVLLGEQTESAAGKVLRGRRMSRRPISARRGCRFSSASKMRPTTGRFRTACSPRVSR